MTTTEKKLLELLLNEREISRLLVKFSRCIDTKDFDEYARLYAVDGELRTPWGGHRGQKGLAEHVRRDLGQFEGLHHVSAGHAIDIDGDTATVRATLLATHVIDTARAEFWSVGGHYDMSLVRENGTWKFSTVEIHPAWRFDSPPHRTTEEA